jgi:hypothetical protein
MNNQTNCLATLWPWVTGQAFRLTCWLYAQVLPSTVRPSVRFDLATAHLVIQRVVLPGVPGLACLLARVCERTGRYLDSQFRSRLNPAQQEALESKKGVVSQPEAGATSKRVL